MNFLLAMIHPSYWWTHQHPIPEFWKVSLTIFFGALLVIGLIAALLSTVKKFTRPSRRAYTRLSAWAFVMGIFGFVLLFFSVQQVSYVSARGFYLLWFFIAALWLYGIVRYAVKDIPRLLEQQKQKEMREKYLPKKKK